MRKKRILFGSVDIGYRIETYSKFINRYYPDKLEVESFSKYVLPHSHYKTEYTYTCPIDKTPPLVLYAYSFFFFLFALFRYDIFHFFSGETILTRKLRRTELRIYKLLNKKVIMHFVGSDIKDPEYLKWKSKNISSFLEGVDDFPKSTQSQKKLIADAERFADYIFVSTPDLIELVPSAIYYPIVLDLKKYLNELEEAKDDEKTRTTISVLHAPSNIELKGTEHIHNALKRIALEKKNVSLILPAEKMMDSPKIYSVSRYELFKLFNESDLVIDQMIIGWYGLQTVEALAANKKVICYIDDKLKKFLYPGCPIISADVNNLEEAISECIDLSSNVYDNEFVSWVEKYHTIENNNEPLLKAWGLIPKK